jgi:hypothetical protein
MRVHVIVQTMIKDRSTQLRDTTDASKGSGDFRTEASVV